MHIQSSLSAVLFTGMFALSCGYQAKTYETGHVNVSISAMTSPQAITSITIEAQPANVIRNLTYDNATATFSGLLMLPTGTQTLTARAYAETQTVGQGAATVTIVADQTARVFLRILDTSAPTPMPDSSPGIFALVLSTTRPAVNQPVSMRVSAADPNGNALSYAWTSTCASGSFSTTSSPDTTWTNTAVGVCTVTITVTANNKSASQQVDIVTLDGSSGVASIEGTYVPAPQIAQVSASAPGFSCTMGHFSPDAMCSRSVSPGQAVWVSTYFFLGETRPFDAGVVPFDAGVVPFDAGVVPFDGGVVPFDGGVVPFDGGVVPFDGGVVPFDGGTRPFDGGVGAAVDVTLTDNCGGPMLHLNAYTYGTSGSANATWTAPSTPAVCVLTLTVTQETMVDRLSFAIIVK